MSRISRHQDSINKFIKNKSCLNNIEGNIRISFNKYLDDNENMLGILVLTIVSCNSKKKATSQHGYYMSFGSELMLALIRMTELSSYYKNKIGKMAYYKLLWRIPTIINICLSQNIEHVQTKITKEKALKIFHYLNRNINMNMYELINDFDDEKGDFIRKTDLLKYNFINNKFKEKIGNIRQYKKENMINYIDKKYGQMCKMALTAAWLLGGGNEKKQIKIDKLGYNIGYMIKISQDFLNIERDIEYALQHPSNTTLNYVINCGIQCGFELFIESKIKVIECCIYLDIYTNTVKEVIDFLESRIENVIDNTVPDLKSLYTIKNDEFTKQT